jgi:hypothetical protein
VLHQGVLNVIFRGILELDVLIVEIIRLMNLIKVVVAGDCFKFTEHGENRWRVADRSGWRIGWELRYGQIIRNQGDRAA